MIKFPYIYIEACPRCQSLRTGFTLTGDFEKLKTMKRFAKLGVLTKNGSNSRLLYCNECKNEWLGHTKIIWLTKDEIKNQKIERRTKKYFVQLKRNIKENTYKQPKRRKNFGRYFYK